MSRNSTFGVDVHEFMVRFKAFPHWVWRTDNKFELWWPLRTQPQPPYLSVTRYRTIVHPFMNIVTEAIRRDPQWAGRIYVLTLLLVAHLMYRVHVLAGAVAAYAGVP